MMDRLGWVLVLLSLWMAAPTTPARSHGGHAVIPQEEAVAKGQELLALLVGRGKVPATWSSATLERASLEMVDEIEEWHLVFRNDTEPDEGKRRLFVFLNYDGQVLAANFSGKTD